jgi:translation initiation factor 2 beta subunit (eIF-2beta)/eIF-5
MDSSKLNIPSTVKDPNYRYQMPKIQVTTQGTGGGVKTRIDNIKEVAHALTVPPDYPLKFIGRELGSNTEIKNDNYLINGSHTAEKFQQILDKFIEKYVLCPNCKLPEIRIFIKKGEIRCKCRACGTISKLDDKHKFSTHIKNFPPTYDQEPEKTTPVVGKDKTAGDSKSQPKKTIDKETAMKIKSSMEKIEKIVASLKDEAVVNSQLETLFNENKFEMEIKYFVLVNGLFNKNIYQQLKCRIHIFKNFLNKEPESHKDEAVFYLLGGIADLTFNRFRDVKDLSRYIPSILYYLYVDDLITEDYWVKYAIKNTLPPINSILFTKENEARFFDAAAEFTNWIENSPYEDEEVKSQPVKQGTVKEVLVKKPIEEEIDIDNI